MKNKLVKIARKTLPKGALKNTENAYRITRTKMVSLRYGNPARGLRIIAVTGTNGKTTTACYINEILKEAGFKTALFTTAVIEIAGQEKVSLKGERIWFVMDEHRDGLSYQDLQDDIVYGGALGEGAYGEMLDLLFETVCVLASATDVFHDEVADEQRLRAPDLNLDVATQRITKAKRGIQRIHLAQPLHVEGTQNPAPPFLLKVGLRELPP